MNVRTEVYNLEFDGSKDFLSAGLTQLPSLYFVYFIAYLAFLGFWIYICFTNRGSVHRIHLLMGGLLLMKALNLICAAEDKHYVKVTGTPHGWDVLFYIFQFIRVVLLFTVIVLIGTGWALYKDWVTWNQVFLLVDIICCCAIIFPIVWSIRSLRETSKTDGKAARNLAKLQLFRQFYIVVIGYLYFTRIVVFALKTIAAYKYQWACGEDEYFVLDEEEEEAAEMALKDEEFEL
ncbi:hypothetical protein GH714_012428 [Hevea brasiliensis]|uniref:GOST seven transmembrane domain-containing protein n=1 Tax=Hevea brasiliensis TaxID=3981 RepID=A0A6A6M0D8_HEVBR|nr:hypothetical protein GH714_012428 [Hevea brasiliensis]